MYKAVVSRITVTPHPNADLIAVGNVANSTVIVSKQTESGTLGVFFPADGQLSDLFCKANNLYPIYDGDGKKAGGGFFDINTRRVRAQSFRGVRSEGFWIPLEALIKWVDLWQGGQEEGRKTVWSLREGDLIDSIEGTSLCERYETPATKRAKGNAANQTKQRRAHPLFFKHMDTLQLKASVYSIVKGSLITITEKLHGTSGRYTRQQVPVKVPEYSLFHRILYFLLNKFLYWLGLERFFELSEEELLVGSRNVELSSSSDKFRTELTLNPWFDLNHGETVYGEFVGYNGDTPIMGRHHVDKSSNPALKKYGKSFAYSYGCEPGSWKFYVYRISLVSGRGDVVDLSHAQVVARCEHLGVDPVPHFETLIYDGNPQSLFDIVAKYVDGDSTLDSRHLREGVVVRVDDPKGKTTFFKEKSFDFKVLEGIAKDSQDYVDAEEIS